MKSKFYKQLILVLLSTFVVTGNDYRVNNFAERASITNSFKSCEKILTDCVVNEDSTIPYDDIHSATWYNAHGRNTASGERFHKDSLTAAYNFDKFGTLIKVTNIENEKSVIVKVTDRMGNKSSNKIDLSIAAFDSIANLSSGRLKVRLEKIK